MDFEDDIRQFILADLPHDPTDEAELRAMNVLDLLDVYFNWTDRFVTPTPRTVHWSAELGNNPLATDPRYKPALDHIVSALEGGTDVGPHLSKLIAHGYENASKVTNRRDLDLMLNDWGIHHLHLSTVIGSDGWVQRTGPLLFAVFRPQDAYLIDIREHGAWYEEDLIGIIVANWPKAGLVLELQGFELPALSPQHRKQLRETHYVTGIPVDGKAYFPAYSLATSGHSEHSTNMAITVFRWMKLIEAKLRDDPAYLSERCAASGLTLPGHPDLHFEFFPSGGWGIVERQTGQRLPLG